MPGLSTFSRHELIERLVENAKAEQIHVGLLEERIHDLKAENKKLREASKDVAFCLVGVIQFIRDVGRPDVAKMVETYRDILVSARRK